jgi:cold shock CspA family protein
MPHERATGTVKTFFNGSWGFIARDGGSDVFLHVGECGAG